MLAKDSVDGGLYNIPGKGQAPSYNHAICNGWNHTHEWLLFIVYDERGIRKIKLVMPNQEIVAVQAIER